MYPGAFEKNAARNHSSLNILTIKSSLEEINTHDKGCFP
jgi:hypothetical protein